MKFVTYLFGGITVVFGGDFHQTLSVVSKGTCQQVVVASLFRENLWRYIKFLHLRHNMYLGNSEADNHHAQWLLDIGAGLTMDDNKTIQATQSMLCANLNTLINRVYPGIGNPRPQENQYSLDCIILCLRNDEVHDINEATL